MTNEEKARTLSLQDHLSNDDYALCPSNDTIIRLNAYGAAMKMAEWKEKEMIEKAVKWMEDNINNYIVNDQYELPNGSMSRDWLKVKSECFTDFKKAMKGE